MATQIPLTKDKFAIIDDEDAERVLAFKWSYCPAGTGYATRNAYLGGGRKNPIRKTIALHRFIMNAPKGLSVDHINGDSLDCQKSNLRVCTHAENTRNKRKHIPSASGYKGAYFDKRCNLFQALIRLDGKSKSLGYYKTAKEAAKAYNNAAYEAWGQYAHLNKLEIA